MRTGAAVDRGRQAPQSMTRAQVLAFVRKHGTVFEAGRGPVVSFADAAGGKPVRGSWWGHPEGRDDNW